MRNKILLIAICFTFAVLALLLCGVKTTGAIGVSTNNATMPDMPDGEQTQNEIKPQVKYSMLGPTTQSQTTSPSVNLTFIGPREQGKFIVTANETWSLRIDINVPGWVYLYEYYPGGSSSGKWIAYKWQLAQSGLWELGPFTADTGEPEGEHIYRVWFYSDGRWAEDSAGTSIIHWMYARGQIAGSPAQQPAPQSPVVSAKDPAFLDQLKDFITMPAVYLSIVLVIVAAVGFYLYRRYKRPVESESAAALPDDESADREDLPAVAARLLLPNGMDIRLDGDGRIIGRADISRCLGLDDLALISKRHFEITCESGQFYIRDLDSLNGTRVNGTDIGGSGMIVLNDDDLIEPAGAVSLRFYLL